MTAYRNINIYKDGIWAGAGLLGPDMTIECDAVLGRNQDESDDIYDAIEGAIDDGGPQEIVGPDGARYSWMITVETE